LCRKAPEWAIFRGKVKGRDGRVVAGEEGDKEEEREEREIRWGGKGREGEWRVGDGGKVALWLCLIE